MLPMMPATIDLDDEKREGRALYLALHGHVELRGKAAFVTSQRNPNEWYAVDLVEPSCDCPDYVQSNEDNGPDDIPLLCKHIRAALLCRIVTLAAKEARSEGWHLADDAVHILADRLAPSIKMGVPNRLKLAALGLASL